MVQMRRIYVDCWAGHEAILIFATFCDLFGVGNGGEIEIRILANVCK